jgi:hypothetical protein
MSVACGRYAAAFSLDDPDVLVGAALCCPMCLGGASRTEIGTVDGEVVGACACGDCGATWSLALEPQQLLRLALDPPRGADVRFSRRFPPSII